MITTFKNDEIEYSRWLARNPRGFVFNHFGGSDGDFNVLHRASCVHLQQAGTEGRRTAVEKVVGNDIGRLVKHLDKLRSSGDGWKSCAVCCPY